ncbi:AAA family ATPase [Carnobacterium maltaromaticum]|uniref:AAA family ATPase n=1 Tax=Carnobacterium maltaromaticum TaxID=2751 RepID=UPI0039BE768C
MKLRNINIKNFKGIEELDLQFEEGFNLIIGDNGSGKTSILDAISVSLGGFTSGVEGVYGKHFTKNEVRIITKTLGDASYNIVPMVPVVVEANAIILGDEVSWTRRKSSLLASRSTIEPKNITKIADSISRDDNSILPILSYQGASRMWSEKRNTSKRTSKNMSRSSGYIGSLSPESNTKMLINWCRDMEQISWQEDKKISEYESVKKAVSKFMTLMSSNEISSVFYDKKREELMYRTDREILPISYLSSGYQSLIWLVFDIAYRMAILNPNLFENVIDYTTGVVLIDEIDVHLHPKWQWNVIGALKKTFPRVQFIVTTHSPIVLASCKDQVISISEDGNVNYKQSSYGVPLDNVLGGYQDSRVMPVEIKKQFEEFNKELDENVEKADEILKELAKELGDTNPLIVNANLNLEFERLEFGEEGSNDSYK